MTLADIAEAVSDVCGMEDATSLVKIKRAIDRRVRMIYDAHLWRDALSIVTRTANDDELVMPHAIERVVAVRYNSQMIYPVDQQTLLQYDPEIFERSGSVLGFSHLTPVALHTLPTSAEALTVVSNNGSDSSACCVLLRGSNGSGLEQVETIALNGLTPVSSGQSWLIVTTASKNVTTGTLTITGATSAVVMQTLWAEEVERKHPRIRLHEQPSDITKTLLVLGKRRYRPMTSDLDTPPLRSIDNAIVAYARADEWKRQRQYGKSNAEAAEAAAQVAIALDGEKNQGAAIMRLVPAMDGGDELGDFGFSGKGYW